VAVLADFSKFKYNPHVSGTGLRIILIEIFMGSAFVNYKPPLPILQDKGG